MHIEAKVVAGAVRHPAAVLLALGADGFLDGHGQQAPFRQALSEDSGGGRVDVAELGAGLRGGEAGVRCVQDSLVDLALDLGKRAVGGQGTGDVSRIEGIGLNAGIQQQELAGVDRSGVPRPVQHGGVVARGRDGVVAQLIALFPGTGKEGSLDDALAAPVGQGPGEGLDDLGEPFHGRGHGGLHLLDFPRILEQADLGEGLGELLIKGIQHAQVQVVRVLGSVVAGRVHQGVDVLVHLAHQPDGDTADLGGAHILGDCQFELVDVGRGEAQPAFEFCQRGAGADPEFAGAGVCIELFGVPAGEGPEVKGGAVVPAVVALSFFNRFENEHGVGLVVEAQARQVGETGVGAEAVVAVVGADLQRAGGDHQAFALEQAGNGATPGGGVIGHGVPIGELLCRGRPVAGHEGLEGVGTGPLRAVVDALFEGLVCCIFTVVGVVCIVHRPIVSPAAWPGPPNTAPAVRTGRLLGWAGED
ncbi:hypothetical protein D9M72_348880 [compost metagenome]